MKNRQQKPSAPSQTGLHPRADFTSSAPQEPPDSLPEMADPGGTTGSTPAVIEGEDAAKNRDDSATGTRPRR
jgi:hypothetical protein